MGEVVSAKSSLATALDAQKAAESKSAQELQSAESVAATDRVAEKAAETEVEKARVAQKGAEVKATEQVHAVKSEASEQVRVAQEAANAEAAQSAAASKVAQQLKAAEVAYDRAEQQRDIDVAKVITQLGRWVLLALLLVLICGAPRFLRAHKTHESLAPPPVSPSRIAYPIALKKTDLESFRMKLLEDDALWSKLGFEDTVKVAPSA